MTIPASAIVSVIPNVLTAGGNAIDLNGLILTDSVRPPIGTVQSFSSPTAVAEYFGGSSTEKQLSDVYFAGFNGATARPGAMLFAQYPTAAVSAYLRGGSVAALTLAQLQAISGTLNVTIDSVLKTGTVNLSSATGFTGAAQSIAGTIGIHGIQTAALTGAVGGTFTGTTTSTTLTVSAVIGGILSVGDTVTANDGTNTLNATITAFVSGSGGTGTYTISGAATPGNLTSTTVTAASNVLNVTAVASGTIAVGNEVADGGLSSNVYISAQLTGTAGNTGHYTITGSAETVASGTHHTYVAGVEYDSVTGAFVVHSSTTGPTSTITVGSGAAAASLMLTTATGAVLSQGAAAAVPGTFMDGLLPVNRDWATFMTTFDPDASGNANKLLFAAWTSAQEDLYAYVCWDNDLSPSTTVPATTSLGYLIAQANYGGTCLIGEDAADAADSNVRSLAAFICGYGASLNFEQQNGRATAAFRAQDGLSASVTSQTAAANLLDNGYNFYGAYANANTEFVWFYDGSISGAFTWLDSYLNQIWLNANLQLALLTLLQNTNAVPFNTSGYAMIEAAMSDVINAALRFGAINTDVPLSASQKAAVNAAAGTDVASVLTTRGWAVTIPTPSASIRSARGPLTVLFWYTDGGAVQKIELSSTALE